MARSLTVLLVEDDDPLRSVLLELLRQRGWHVHATGRGDEAVEIARRVRVDISILDLHLPGLSGVEVYQRIAAEIRPVPSILMSGEATREEARLALELGIAQFLRKPLDLQLLRRALDELIQRHVLGQDASVRSTRPGSNLPVRLQDLYPDLGSRTDQNLPTRRRKR
jgi:DNA-binding response OmpR family regulator